MSLPILTWTWWQWHLLAASAEQHRRAGSWHWNQWNPEAPDIYVYLWDQGNLSWRSRDMRMMDEWMIGWMDEYIDWQRKLWKYFWDGGMDKNWGEKRVGGWQMIGWLDRWTGIFWLCGDDSDGWTDEWVGLKREVLWMNKKTKRNVTAYGWVDEYSR